MDDETREYIDERLSVIDAQLQMTMAGMYEIRARLDQIEADHAGETEADTPEG